MTEVLQEV